MITYLKFLNAIPLSLILMPKAECNNKILQYKKTHLAIMFTSLSQKLFEIIKKIFIRDSYFKKNFEIKEITFIRVSKYDSYFRKAERCLFFYYILEFSGIRAKML